jgi:hypothetical protein|nr:MAG TPA: stabilization protein [Caudoviricetes sp.]DAY99297.1 MAG TPA: stabilization protein [Caudoviricetes sp.]
MATGIKRTYADFSGVDFLNEPTLVSITRSPDALNVWKNYRDAQGTCIETRPGYRKIAQIGNRINGIYIFSLTKALIHSGTVLYEWSNFPSEPTSETLKQLYADMNNKRSKYNKLDSKLYINDGKNYLVYDGTILKKVKDEAFVPRTTISRTAGNMGGGETLQDVNLLQPKRINSFVGDGTSKIFYLDAQNIDSTTVTVTVDNKKQTENSNFTVDRVNGKVTFNTAPSKPNLSGEDNVFITFSKTISGYEDRINKCTKALLFDNRMFFTGNPDFPNAVFHSELNNPAYISDLSYYEDGSSDSSITGMTVGNNVLWIFKNLDQNNANVFYHEPTLDLEHGKIYPTKQGNVSVGCYVDSTNFQDDIVYLSRYGLEGISTEKIDSKQAIAHRSFMVDVKMTNENNYKDAMMTEYQGYLLILVNGKIYLADSRQKYANLDSFGYEWFYWDFTDINPILLKEYNDKLYIGTDNGSIFILEGTNDNGKTIISYWTTPMDNFGYNNQLKTTNKRGGLAKIKTIPNGLIKIARRTDKSSEYKYTTRKSANGFSFESLDFRNFSFITTDKSYVLYKIKEKKLNELSLKFYSDEKDKPFGIFSSTIEAFVGGYIKK